MADFVARNKQAPPTVAGWYYARHIYDLRKNIVPTCFNGRDVCLLEDVNGSVEEFDWFGPVPVMKELFI